MNRKRDPQASADALRACALHILGTAYGEPPSLDPADPVTDLRDWLAARNLALVPVATPDSFAWASHWIALRAATGDATPWRAVVMFGVPPGVVYDPLADEADGAGEEILTGYVIAPLDLRLRPDDRESPSDQTPARGTVRTIVLGPEAGAPLVEVSSAQAGRAGLEGDRYAAGRGHFSQHPGRGRHLTLVEQEALDELAQAGIPLTAAAARRNIVTVGIALDQLIDRRFRIGAVECAGIRRCEPCAHLEQLTTPGVLRGLVHRGGLRADILQPGTIRASDPITL